MRPMNRPRRKGLGFMLRQRPERQSPQDQRTTMPSKTTSSKPAAKKAPAKKAPAKKASGKPNALQQPLQPSKELAAVVGSNPLPRGEVVSKMWDYIKKHKLQNPENKREI